MDVITLEAKQRETGKSAARAARRAGEVPCVLYGHNIDPVVFQVEELSLDQLIHTAEAHLVKVEMDGQSWDCILKDVDFDPVSDRPLHADFQVLLRGEKITMTVPIQFRGTPVGQTEGGTTQFILNEMEIACLPMHIPSYIEVDIAHLQVGDAMHVSDLEIEGIEFHASPQQTLVAVVPPRGLEVEEEEAEGLLDLDEEEEGLEGEAPEGEADEETEA